MPKLDTGEITTLTALLSNNSERLEKVSDKLDEFQKENFEAIKTLSINVQKISSDMEHKLTRSRTEIIIKELMRQHEESCAIKKKDDTASIKLSPTAVKAIIRYGITALGGVAAGGGLLQMLG